MSASTVVAEACDKMVLRVLKDEHYLDKWTDDEIDEAVYYTRLFVLEVLVDMKYKESQLVDDKGRFDALDRQTLENYAMDGIGMVRSFDRGY